ncbi:syntabulin isoform X1 [Crotalus tigris]|uniref:syntabulin isoform X1 n=1 Tax=Crotalus tigris TaxID=88082 RepID=UPI00192F7D05|nr:syntabulin isoform X1 [Crotalus tigris]
MRSASTGGRRWERLRHWQPPASLLAAPSPSFAQEPSWLSPPGGMGPLRESDKKEHRMQDKELCRSRIPRLVLRPHLPQQHFPYQKVSPASESPFSEEESKEFNPLSSSGGSARTISSNSFCSDDTGCPSSQSVSPVKTPPDTGNSPIAFCTGSDGGDYARKKFNSGTVADGTHQSARYKKEAKTNLIKPGSEADFSSSSSTGSISAPEVHMSAGSGNKRSSFPRNRGPHGRNHGSLPYKSGSSPPTTTREKDFLLMLCKNQLSPVNPHQNYGASSASSSNSGSYKGNDNSPTFRRPARYNSCGENHGIKPPSPEQYLTPLQQKEVTVRHLKTKLKESESRLQERESEIKELKSQLARMRDDWIEEECHRVEAQLALKEARKEIKQLKQVIETMKNSLAEKDKGIQKYFVDINIQNKKLESLLQSMELAQNDSSREDQSLEYECESPDKSFTTSTTYSKMADSMLTENHSVEADSGVLLSDDVANGNDIFEETMYATTPEFGHSVLFTSSTFNHLDLVQSLGNFQVEVDNPSEAMEQAVQADVLLYRSGIEQLIENIFKTQDGCPISPSPVLVESSVSHPESISNLLVDLTPTDPNSAILLSPLEPMPSAIDSRYYKNRVMKELDFIDYDTKTLGNVTKLSEGNIVKRYWSSNFLIDLLAIGAPIVPTIMWMFSTRKGGTIPIFTFGALFRGCCLLALNSLRHEPLTLQP